MSDNQITAEVPHHVRGESDESYEDALRCAVANLPHAPRNYKVEFKFREANALLYYKYTATISWTETVTVDIENPA